eukprot:327007-Rhodomonas_salina.1
MLGPTLTWTASAGIWSQYESRAFAASWPDMVTPLTAAPPFPAAIPSLRSAFACCPFAITRSTCPRPGPS